jgi:hypothetical protein
MQKGGDGVDHLGLHGGQLRKAERIERVSPKVPAIHLFDELFHIVATGGVDETEEAGAVDVWFLALTAIEVRQKLSGVDSTLVHCRRL